MSLTSCSWVPGPAGCSYPSPPSGGTDTWGFTPVFPSQKIERLWRTPGHHAGLMGISQACRWNHFCRRAIILKKRNWIMIDLLWFIVSHTCRNNSSSSSSSSSLSSISIWTKSSRVTWPIEVKMKSFDLKLCKTDPDLFGKHLLWFNTLRNLSMSEKDTGLYLSTVSNLGPILVDKSGYIMKDVLQQNKK